MVKLKHLYQEHGKEAINVSRYNTTKRQFEMAQCRKKQNENLKRFNDFYKHAKDIVD
jgi:hypothetical protein